MHKLHDVFTLYKNCILSSCLLLMAFIHEEEIVFLLLGALENKTTIAFKFLEN